MRPPIKSRPWSILTYGSRAPKTLWLDEPDTPKSAMTAKPRARRQIVASLAENERLLKYAAYGLHRPGVTGG